MGAFEDYVNANLGIRKPLITDSGLPSQSPKAAGIIGSQYVDSDTYFLYEKTGEDNALDWVKIADLGQSRGGEPGGEDGSVQFNSGDSFGGSEGLIYDRDLGLLSGESGRFDYIHSDYVTGDTGHFTEELIVGDPSLPSSENVFVVEDGNIVAAGSATFSGSMSSPTGYFNELTVSGNARIGGDFYVSGTTYVEEIIDTTVSGSISGYTGIFKTVSGASGFFDNLSVDGSDISQSILDLSIRVDSTGQILSGNIDTVSGESIASFSALSDDLNTTGQILSGNIDTVSGDLSNRVNSTGQILSGNIDTVSGESIASFSALSDDLNTTGQSLLNSRRDYPVLTGVEFDQSTNILSFFRDFGATNIDIDLSSLAGGGLTYQSTLWWEENNQNLTLLNEETNTSFPATQLFEESGVNAYAPREETLSSNNEAAQYFEETGVDVTIRESSYLPPINNSAVSTQWFEDFGSEQLAVRETFLNTSNPAVQLWEPTGSNQYTPRSEPYSSNNESAKYFEETGDGRLTTTIN